MHCLLIYIMAENQRLDKFGIIINAKLSLKFLVSKIIYFNLVMSNFMFNDLCELCYHKYHWCKTNLLATQIFEPPVTSSSWNPSIHWHVG